MEESEAFTPDSIELAWAAGLFDGEGYIAFRYNKAYNYKRHGFVKFYRRMEVQISQLDPQVLHRFQRTVGCGTVTGPYKAKGRINPMWKFGTGGYPNVVQIFNRIKPYLSPVKLQQGLTAFQLYNESPESYIEAVPSINMEGSESDS